MLPRPPANDRYLTKVVGVLNSVLDQREIEILGVVDDGTNWNIRYRATLAAPFVQVHVQSSAAGEGGETYDAGNYTSTTVVDCRAELLQDLALTLLVADTYTVFFIPVQYDAAGTKVLYDGVAADDRMVFVSQTNSGGVTGSVFTTTGYFTSTDDVDLVGVSGSIILGGDGTGQHIAIDADEIMSKSDATTAGTLGLQLEGGTVNVGSVAAGVAMVPSTSFAPQTTGALTLGTAALSWGAAWMGALTATSGTFTAPVSITSTTYPPFTLAYDVSNYMTMSVLNDGEVEFNAVGTDCGFKFADNTGIGTSPSTTSRLEVRWVSALDIGSARTAVAGTMNGSLAGDPGDADRRRVFHAALDASPDVATTQSGACSLYSGTLGLGGLGTISTAYGYWMEIAISTDTIVTDLFGYYYRGAINHGALGNEYGFYRESSSDSETIQNQYGYYCEDIADGVVSNYSWYSNAGEMRLGGNLTFNNAAGQGLSYGCMYIYEGTQNIDISAAAGAYVKITGLSAGEMNNVSENSDAFNVVVTGRYKIDWMLSGDSAGNNITYDCCIFVNGSDVDRGSRQKFGVAADVQTMAGTAIVDITDAAHDIDLRMKQVDGGTQYDIDIYHLNFNIVQVGGT